MISIDVKDMMDACTLLPAATAASVQQVPESGPSDMLRAQAGVAASSSSSSAAAATAAGQASHGAANSSQALKVGAKALDVCMACGKTAADVGAVKLLKCSACTIAPVYCSAACQSACWKEHKVECKANRKADK